MRPQHSQQPLQVGILSRAVCPPQPPCTASGRRTVSDHIVEQVGLTP